MKKIKIELDEDYIGSHASCTYIYVPNEKLDEYPKSDDKECFIDDFVAEWKGKPYFMHTLAVHITDDWTGVVIVAVTPDRPMNEREIIGWNLMEARRESGLSIEELAEKVKISALTLYKIENGRFTASGIMLQKIAAAMGREIIFK